jgi:hypothetical protein
MRSTAQTVTESDDFQQGKAAFSGMMARMRQMSAVDMIAGGIITLVVVAIVLNQLLTLEIVNNTTGPFSGLIDSVENIGSASLTLIVVGFLAAAAGVVLSMFRGRF